MSADARTQGFEAGQLAGAPDPAGAWWRDGVLYQIYPRSFGDADGDGVGDLRGIIDHLDHLEWLGIDGIWLNPTMPSPNEDWGYDVADYCGVHPDLGTLADLDALVAEAGRRGIRVLLDLVPNHTSDQHAWFQAARSSRAAPERERYVWADPKPDGGPPNNWLSAFGGSAWTLDDASGQYYLHNFMPGQPDLNWWDEGVREAFDAILRFWFERGIAGFRIDVAHSIIKDAELRDDPASTEADHPEVRREGQRREFSMNRPEVHDVLRRWRALTTREAPERILVGETYVLALDQLIPFYGDGEDELHLAFNFLFVHAELATEPMRAIVEEVEDKLPEASWPVYTGSNHDAGRLVRRWAEGDPARVRCALLMLLTLRGTPFLYYGDEIGMPEVALDPAAALDPVPHRSGDPSRNRDPCRTPMQWTGEAGGGFTRPDAQPWLPLGDTAACNVADQRADPGSTLHLVRDLIALRRAQPDLHAGSYASLEGPAGVWAWRRGSGWVTVLNLSEAPVEVSGIAGAVTIGTDRGRDGDRLEGSLWLAPAEGVLVDLTG